MKRSLLLIPQILARLVLVILLSILVGVLTPNAFASYVPTPGQWTAVGLTSSFINGVTVDPTNSNILYAGTSGEGIYKSTDGGTTWSTINTGLEDPASHGLSINVVIVDPTNSSVIYAGGGDGGQTIPQLYKSTNGGANWALATSGISPLDNPPSNVNDMAIDPTNPSTLYAAIAVHCGDVFKSTDGAATWTPLGHPGGCDPYTVRVDPFNHNTVYVVGQDNHLYKSTDAGANWTSPSGFSFDVAALTLDPFTASTLYSRGNDGTAGQGIYKTTDGGANWTFSTSEPAVFRALLSDSVRHGTVYVGLQDTPDPVVPQARATYNGGQSWVDISSGLPNNVRNFAEQTNGSVLFAATGTGIYGYDASDAPPQVGSILLSVDPAHVNSPTVASASFTDPDTTDTHTASWNWGDGTTSTGTVTESGGSGSVSHSHTYTALGTYTVTLTVTDNHGAQGQKTRSVTVVKQLTALGPAKLYISRQLPTIRLDLKADVYKDSTLVSSGEIDSVAPSFLGPTLETIPFNTFVAADFPQGSVLKIVASVRNACSGSVLNAGNATIYYNNTPVDSRFDATIGAATSTYHLRDGFILSTSSGTSQKTVTVAAGAKCSAFKPFGTWTVTP